MWAMTAASTTTAPTPPHAGRRLELVISAQRVVGAGGLRALTHRAVDADAGLPEGSCSSYYRTKVALLGALTEHIGHQLRVSVLDLGGRLDVVHARHPDGQERTDAVVGEVVALFERWLDEPGLVVTQAELGLEALRQPELGAALAEWRAGLVDVVAEIAAGSGKECSRGRADGLVAALEGILLAGLTHAAEDGPARAERAAYLTDAVLLVLTPLA
jgi:DNA-binding transcriptional regulator YbjK